MKYLVEPKNITLSWCPFLCKEYGPAPLYGVPPCRSY